MEEEIVLELSKALDFDQTSNWYIYKTETLQEYEMHYILWDWNESFNPNQKTRPSFNLQTNINWKEICSLVNFIVQAEQRVKI